MLVAGFRPRTSTALAFKWIPVGIAAGALSGAVADSVAIGVSLGVVLGLCLGRMQRTMVRRAGHVPFGSFDRELGKGDGAQRL